MAVFFLAALGVEASSTVKMPPNYLMECPAQDFESRSLSVKATGDRVDFLVLLPSTKLHFFKELVNIIPNDMDWGSAEMSFSMPLNSCRISSEDAKIFTCRLGYKKSLAVKLRLDVFNDITGATEKYVQEVELKEGVWTQIRKVHQVNVLNPAALGVEEVYEFVVGKDIMVWPEWKPFFMHNLFKRRCQVSS